jgi:TonB family protein
LPRLILCVLILLAVARTLGAQTAIADSAAVAALVTRHEAAIVTGNAELLRHDYAAATVWISSVGVRRTGQDSILSYLARLFADSGAQAARHGASDSLSVSILGLRSAFAHMVIHRQPTRVTGLHAIPGGRTDVEFFLSKDSDGWTIQQEIIADERPATEVKSGTVELIGMEPVGQTHCDAPRFPQSLRRAVATGHVVLEYVVGATGHLEPESFKVVSSSDRGFETAAIDAVKSCAFKSGQFFRTPVRQLVRQGVSFTLNRD